MKEPIFTPGEILVLGFQLIEKVQFDDGGYYKYWVFYKNDNELHITYEFDNKHNFTTGYVEFNGEKLKGRELTKNDIQLLIEIM